MNIAYYPGCTLRTNAKNFESSAIASAKFLNINFVEPERWNCCGTVHALVKDDVMHYLAPIRNLIRVDELKRDELVDDKRFLTLCAMCYNTLKRANMDALNDEEKLTKIKDVMENEEIKYSGNVEVFHFLEVLRELGWDKIKERIQKPLKNLKVAPYYGCLLLRPRGMGIDDTDHPTIMEDLLEVLGAEVIDSPYKQKCCGSYHTIQLKEVASDLSYRVLKYSKEAGADIIATACPLCEFNLGERHQLIEEKYPDFETIPVVYFTQLMSLALGLDEEANGFEGNNPDPRPLLKERGLL